MLVTFCKFVLSTFLYALCISGLPVCAQQLSATPPVSAPPQISAGAPGAEQPVKVLCILESDGNTCSKDPEAGLDHEITLRVQGLKKWLDDEKIDPDQLTLYLSEREMLGIHPRSVDKEAGKIIFLLSRTPDAVSKTLQNDDSKQAWAIFLSPPRLYRNVRVSFGKPKSNAVPGGIGMRFLILMRPWSLVLLAVALAGLAVLLYYAIIGDLLRNPGKLPKSLSGKQKKSYSLAKTQMLFWFTIVFFSFVVIWLVTWDRMSIPGSILGLLGISAGTTAGGMFLGQKQQEAKQKAAASGQNISAVTAGVQAETSSAASPSQSIGGASPQSSAADTSEATPSLGFWRDICYDNGGPSLQRVQVVFWTAWLGAMFLRAVWDTLAMPDHDASLVGLMAISSSTYLSSKLPSQNQ